MLAQLNGSSPEHLFAFAQDKHQIKTPHVRQTMSHDNDGTAAVAECTQQAHQARFSTAIETTARLVKQE